MREVADQKHDRATVWGALKRWRFEQGAVTEWGMTACCDDSCRREHSRSRGNGVGVGVVAIVVVVAPFSSVTDVLSSFIAAAPGTGQHVAKVCRCRGSNVESIHAKNVLPKNLIACLPMQLLRWMEFQGHARPEYPCVQLLKTEGR
uniref:Uncharacterized protein n=1 Tax=Oryza meridionalis TaxID=40149 RepID=A0A0E0E1J6_9ORYZ